MAGLACWGRAQLWRHPSFWAEEDAEQLPNQIVEDPRVYGTEKQIYHAISSQVCPFIATLDEYSVNVGPLLSSESQPQAVFKRCLSSPPGNTTDFGWRDRHAAYVQCDKINLGTERVVCNLDPQDCQRRLNQRLMIGRLETIPPLASRTGTGGGNSLFEAFCQALWGSPTYHALLRQLVIRYMKEDPVARAEYSTVLGDDYDEYVCQMAHLGTPGDELVLRALADRFGLPITVVTGDEVVWCVRYPPRTTTTQREIFLAVVPTAKFSAVRRQSTLASIKMTFSSSPEQKKAREQRKHLPVTCITGDAYSHSFSS